MKENTSHSQLNIEDMDAKRKAALVFDLPEDQASLADDILNRIQNENIKPRSKWYFMFKNEVFWGACLVSIVIGSFCVAAGMFAISYAEIDLYIATHDSLVEFLFDALPLMWSLSLVFFMILGFIQIRHTKRGYQYPLVAIVGGTLVLSFVGGSVLYTFGFGEMLERNVGGYIPFHRPAHLEKERIWNNAPQGVIAGEVVRVDDEGREFEIVDFGGGAWTVNSRDLMDRDLDIVRVGQVVRVIGIPVTVPGESVAIATGTVNGALATSTMHGCFVLPWAPIALVEEGVSSTTVMVQLGSSSTSTLITIAKTEKVISNNDNEISGERKIEGSRSNECKGVRPYKLIERLRAEPVPAY